MHAFCFFCCRNSEQKMNDPSQSSLGCTVPVLEERRQKHHCCSKGFILQQDITARNMQYSCHLQHFNSYPSSGPSLSATTHSNSSPPPLPLSHSSPLPWYLSSSPSWRHYSNILFFYHTRSAQRGPLYWKNLNTWVFPSWESAVIYSFFQSLWRFLPYL